MEPLGDGEGGGTTGEGLGDGLGDDLQVHDAKVQIEELRKEMWQCKEQENIIAVEMAAAQGPGHEKTTGRIFLYSIFNRN